MGTILVRVPLEPALLRTSVEVQLGPPLGVPFFRLVAAATRRNVAEVSGNCAAFVDVGYLRASVATKTRQKIEKVRLDAGELVQLLNEVAAEHALGATLLRTYWYDGAYDPSHSAFARQRRYLDAVANTPGVQLRLGHLKETPPDLEGPLRAALQRTADALSLSRQELMDAFDAHWEFRPTRQQKGVDTLMTLDLVRLAGRAIFGHAILISGDRDLAEPVRTAQDYGVRVVIATPSMRGLAKELRQLADGVVEFGDAARLLRGRTSK